MFTGLVQSLGRVQALTADGHGGATLTVADAMAPHLVLGESVAVNGCCLTVIRRDQTSFDFQLGPETLIRTSLGHLAANGVVNLERALQLSDRLGGHIVTGHIDAVGHLRGRVTSGDWQTLRFECPAELDDLMVTKGSIAVDGISLTLVDVGKGFFTVMLIPHTLAHTTLGSTPLDGPVNLECDLVAKHVQKLFSNLSIQL